MENNKELTPIMELIENVNALKSLCKTKREHFLIDAILGNSQKLQDYYNNKYGISLKTEIELAENWYSKLSNDEKANMLVHDKNDILNYFRKK